MQDDGLVTKPGEAVDKDKSANIEKKMGRKTVEMFDLLLQRGTKVKAFSKAEEEQRKAHIKLKKLGIDNIE